jgi:two-component system sensor histidine kinase PilS (NtrC family)
VKAVDANRLLRGFSWVRLGLAELLLIAGPLVPPELMPGSNAGILALALPVAVVTSGTILLLGPVARPDRVAALLSLLDVALITAVVAATGGARSIFTFLYVLTVTAACVLLSRTGGLAIAATACVLYTALVLGRTVFPVSIFFQEPGDTTALEVFTIFVNSATFLIVGIVAGGVADKFRVAHEELTTERRHLSDVQAFKDLVFQSVDAGLIAIDRERRVTAFNHAAEDITGLPARQAIGQSWAGLFGDAVDLDAVEATLDAGGRAATRHEIALPHAGGGAVPVRIACSALRAGDGTRVGLIAVCEDLTTFREMERRIRQADRLATLGRMAANIAHEIRNPLASMTGAIEALAANVAALDERDRLAQIVLRESDRLNDIIKSFLEYARPAPLALDTVDVVETLDEILVLLEHRATSGKSVKIVREFPASLSWRLDPQQFRQAVWNLCLNAVEAMPESGELRMGADAQRDRLEVWVADTGDGIAPAELSHVFEPFFSTKPSGSGLGLALVHRIVQDHGGEVDVRTSAGMGTTFTLTFPAHDA